MRKTKKSISLILAIFMLLALAMTASAAPTLDAGGYYQLSTVDDMLWFREQVAQGNVSIDAKLMNDIDLTNVVWKPIWYEALFEEQEINIAATDDSDMPYWYGGTFDGNGKIIKLDTYNNSTFEFPLNPNAPQHPHPIHAGGGLFMGISDTAVIKNFTVTGKITLSGSHAEIDRRFYAAAVVVKSYGTVYNVSVKDFAIRDSGYSKGNLMGAISALSYGAMAMIDGCNVADTIIYTTSPSPVIGLVSAQLYYSAAIKNSSVSDSTILNDAAGTAGGVVGAAVYGVSVSNCSVSGLDLAANIDSTSGFTGDASVYIGGIAGQMQNAYNGISSRVLNCSVSASTLKAITEDGYSYGVTQSVGGIIGTSSTALADASLGALLVQNCIASDVNVETSTSYRTMAGGIVGLARHTQVSQCYADNVVLSQLHKGAFTTSGRLYAGGIVGHVPTLADSTEYKGGILECVINDLSIDAESESNTASVIYDVGAIVGHYVTLSGISGNHSVQNCAATGTINFDVATNNGQIDNIAYIGGLVGVNYAKAHENMMGYFTVTSADTQGTTDWYIGALTGYLIGRDDSSLRAELVDNLYDDEITLALYGRLGTTANRQYIDPNPQATFDGDDLANAATLFASFFKGGELELTAGQTLDLELEAFVGTAGIDLSAASWSSSDPSVVSVSPATGANVTISALEAGSATITCTFMLNGVETTQSVTIVVPGTPDYVDAEAEISGDPADGVIYPGDAVNLTYDFSPYTAIPEIDNSGMDGSGLLAAIVDGKVVLTGTAETPGTYSYVVKLQGTDGSIITQTVSVVVQGGSRPTNRGGGSSNCNSGVGAALFALLGLAFVYKRK